MYSVLQLSILHFKNKFRVHQCTSKYIKPKDRAFFVLRLFDKFNCKTHMLAQEFFLDRLCFSLKAGSFQQLHGFQNFELQENSWVVFNLKRKILRFKLSRSFCLYPKQIQILVHFVKMVGVSIKQRRSETRLEIYLINSIAFGIDR